MLRGFLFSSFIYLFFSCKPTPSLSLSHFFFFYGPIDVDLKPYFVDTIINIFLRFN